MLQNDILSCSTCKKSSISKETDIRSLEGAKEGCRQSRLCAAGTCVRFEAGVLVPALSCLSLHVSLTVGRAETPTLQMGVAHYGLAGASEGGAVGGGRTGVPSTDTGPVTSC